MMTAPHYDALWAFCSLLTNSPPPSLKTAFVLLLHHRSSPICSVPTALARGASRGTRCGRHNGADRTGGGVGWWKECAYLECSLFSVWTNEGDWTRVKEISKIIIKPSRTHARNTHANKVTERASEVMRTNLSKSFILGAGGGRGFRQSKSITWLLMPPSVTHMSRGAQYSTVVCLCVTCSTSCFLLLVTSVFGVFYSSEQRLLRKVSYWNCTGDVYRCRFNTISAFFFKWVSYEFGSPLSCFARRSTIQYCS